MIHKDFHQIIFFLNVEYDAWRSHGRYPFPESCPLYKSPTETEYVALTF